ncbi:hypothetical protein Tco_1400287 [Tanacetum coccineum]
METTVGNNHPTNDRILEVRMLLEPIWLVTMRGMVMKEHFLSVISVIYATKDSVLLSVVTVRGLDIWPGIADLIVMYYSRKSWSESWSYYVFLSVVHKEITEGLSQQSRTKPWNKQEFLMPRATLSLSQSRGGGDAKNSGSSNVTDVSYAVELVDGRTSETNTVLRAITMKENKDKSKEKRLEDVPTVQDFPETKEEHDAHLRLILELLKKEELYAKFSKCDFWLSKVQFLGHVIDSEGIHVDPVKIDSIKDWESPKTPT